MSSRPSSLSVPPVPSVLPSAFTNQRMEPGPNGVQQVPTGNFWETVMVSDNVV